MLKNNRTLRMLAAGAVAAGVFVAGAVVAAGTGSASADPRTAQAANVRTLPPQGARATVKVSPNPTAKRGEEVTITGDCGGGTGLKSVLGGFPGNPVLENIRIVNSAPTGFVAKATLSQKVGNGVGPVLVDCGGEAGVTLLVTHV